MNLHASIRPTPALQTTVVVAVLLSLGVTARAGETTRISIDSSGAQALGGESYEPSISAKGRFIALTSQTANLVSGDTNDQDDVFVRDRKKNTLERVSVASSGAQATGGASNSPSISASGRFVAFTSGATNLVTGDTNGYYDVFVRDRKKQRTTRVSVDSSGVQATGGYSGASAISANGRFVAFESNATDLVTGDTNGLVDIFVHDRKTGLTTRVSVASSGAEATGGHNFEPSISADGRFIAFGSYATNLVTGDSNKSQDVFLHDRQTGETTRVSVDSTGVQADDDSGHASISADGRLVAFDSIATNLVIGDTNSDRDVFVHDRLGGTITRVSVDSIGEQANGGSSHPAISAKGRFVAFASLAVNLVTGDSNGLGDVFVHHRDTGAIERVSVSSSGGEASGGGSGLPVISAKGRFVAFESEATDLVPGDTNGEYDAFLHDRK